jgi:hypothetical protein
MALITTVTWALIVVIGGHKIQEGTTPTLSECLKVQAIGTPAIKDSEKTIDAVLCVKVKVRFPFLVPISLSKDQC